MASNTLCVMKLMMLPVIASFFAGLGWSLQGLQLAVVLGVLSATAWMVWSTHLALKQVLSCCRPGRTI